MHVARLTALHCLPNSTSFAKFHIPKAFREKATPESLRRVQRDEAAGRAICKLAKERAQDGKRD